MILNLIHRYQPGYDECFDFQQRLAHSLGLKVTVFISSSLLCEERRGLAERFIADSERFGDELALWPEPYDAKRGQFIWLLSFNKLLNQSSRKLTQERKTRTKRD